MSADRITLDTNVLVYAVDRDAGERHERAAALVDEAVDLDCVLTLQALSEFFSAVTRKGKMPFPEAAAQVRDWQILFPTATPKPTTLGQAISAVANHSIAFWDALLWAAAKDAGVTLLFSEDFQHGRELGGVRFCNPFLRNPSPV
ncbi:MAG: PIN domain-containing protein [Thermodesulfobacteriota bacterium]